MSLNTIKYLYMQNLYNIMTQDKNYDNIFNYNLIVFFLNDLKSYLFI